MIRPTSGAPITCIRVVHHSAEALLETYCDLRQEIGLYPSWTVAKGSNLLAQFPPRRTELSLWRGGRPRPPGRARRPSLHVLSRRAEQYWLSDCHSTHASDCAVHSRVVLVRT